MINIDGREVFTTLKELVNPEYTALLLIDFQNDFCSRGGYFDRMGTDISTLQLIPPRVNKVLESARRRGVLVIFMQLTYYTRRLAESGPQLRLRYRKRLLQAGEIIPPDDRITMQGTWGCQIVDDLAPLPDEIVVTKHRASAFVGTDLDMILRTNGIKSIVTTGVVTESCVESTARDATFYDYYSVVLQDCVATTNAEIHEASMKVMSYRLDVVDSSEVIKIWSDVQKSAMKT